MRLGLAHRPQRLSWIELDRHGKGRPDMEWNGADRGRSTIDTRAAAAADLELIIRAHQPDAAGHCGSCKAAGDVAPYPCDARLLCEQAAVALQRRRSRAGGTAYEKRRS
jgi:hypothetical protein